MNPFVQLERETNGLLYLSLVEDMLLQRMLDTSQLQEFQAGAQVLEQFDKSDRKRASPATSSRNRVCQHTRPLLHRSISDRIHDSFWVQCSIPQQISCHCQLDPTNMISMFWSEDDALRKDGCLQLMEHVGEAQLRRGVLVVELKAMLKDLLCSKEGELAKPLFGFTKMTRNQLADKARQLQIAISENHTRGHHAAVNTQPGHTRKFYSWITNTAVGSIKWRISNLTGHSRGALRG